MQSAGIADKYLANRARTSNIGRMVSLALYQPDIPQNTGAILRTAVCMGADVHLIHPAGFALTDKGLRRAGMDYLSSAQIRQHDDWDAFLDWRNTQRRRLLALSTKAAEPLYDHGFQFDDIILLGRESAGLPPAVHEAADFRLAIPQVAGTRSLNVAVAGAIALAEAMRQFRSSGFLKENDR